MNKKLGVIAVQNYIYNKEKSIFTPLDLEREFGVSYDTARKFIFRNRNKNNYVKLKRGLYYDKNIPPSEFEIANRLYYPSYVSFEYALSFYGIIPEMVYTITSATSKSSREFIIANISYHYSHIKKEAFSGYSGRDINGKFIFLAEAEKALADYLYFVDLGKRGENDRIDVSRLDFKRLIKYGRLYKRKTLDSLIKKTYDQSRKHKEIIY